MYTKTYHWIKIYQQLQSYQRDADKYIPQYLKLKLFGDVTKEKELAFNEYFQLQFFLSITRYYDFLWFIELSWSFLYTMASSQKAQNSEQ